MNITDQNPEVLAPSALEAISNAEINQSIATARRFPRQLSVVKQKMMSFATLDEATAASCFYSLPRGGKNIQGPSVRLAEIAISCYGNLRVASRIVHTQTTGDNPHVIVQAVAMDLEANTSISIEKRRRIIGKKSRGGVIDEDDINLASNSCSAIALRDAVWKIVPLALVQPVFEAARKVAIGDAKTLTDRRARCMDTFAKMGVTKERVLSKLEKKSVEDVGLDDLETLIGLHNAIKEGEVKIDEAFPLAAMKAANLSDIKAPGAPTTGSGTATSGAGTPTNVTKLPTESPVKAPESVPEGKSTPEPTESAANQAQQAASGAPEPAKEAVDGVKCRYCGAEVESMEGHECDEMRAALAKTEGDPQAEGKLALENVQFLAKQSSVSEAQVIAFCVANQICKKGQVLSDLATSKLKNLGKSWPKILPEIQKISAT